MVGEHTCRVLQSILGVLFLVAPRTTCKIRYGFSITAESSHISETHRRFVGSISQRVPSVLVEAPVDHDVSEGAGILYPWEILRRSP